MNVENGRAPLHNDGIGRLNQHSQWEWLENLDNYSYILLIIIIKTA